MTTLSFDTHEFVKTLQAKGFSADQVEGINDALKNALTIAEVATKRDLVELEYRLTIKIGALIAGAVGLIAAMIKMM